MFIYNLILFFSIFFVWGCSKPERNNIDLYYGLRIDEYIDDKHFEEQCHTVKKNHGRALSIELALQADSLTGLPKINRTSITQFSKVLPIIKKFNLDYSLVITKHTFLPLISSHQLPSISEWFEQFGRELKALLTRVDSYKPKFICLGVRFDEVEGEYAAWEQLVKELKQLTTIPLIYTADLSQVKKIKFWITLDGIGLYYPPESESHPKTISRKWNEGIASFAQSVNKPIYITHTNLFFSDKLNQLKNRLRFWPEDTKINALVINSIYSNTILTDTTPYFSPEQNLIQYLSRYGTQNINN